jgi:hypothetical protein
MIDLLTQPGRADVLVGLHYRNFGPGFGFLLWIDAVNSKTQISTILAKDEEGEFRLWACRGAGKGCDRNKYRRSVKPCDDCLGPLDENLTLDQVAARLKSGDALEIRGRRFPVKKGETANVPDHHASQDAGQ